MTSRRNSWKDCASIRSDHVIEIRKSVNDGRSEKDFKKRRSPRKSERPLAAVVSRDTATDQDIQRRRRRQKNHRSGAVTVQTICRRHSAEGSVGKSRRIVCHQSGPSESRSESCPGNAGVSRRAVIERIFGEGGSQENAVEGIAPEKSGTEENVIEKEENAGVETKSESTRLGSIHSDGNGFRHGRTCSGHPRLCYCNA